MKRILAWVFLVILALLAAALLEQGSGELKFYKIEEIR